MFKQMFPVSVTKILFLKILSSSFCLVAISRTEIFLPYADSMDPSPFVRNSFWGMSVGMVMTWLAGLGISQVSMQRFLAVPNIKEAQK